MSIPFSSGATWLAFLAASLILAITPGPGVLYIVTRSVIQGRMAGLASVTGVALGNLGNALAASIGLAGIFAVSGIAFSIVKYLGALYLIFLGIQAMRQSSSAALPNHSSTSPDALYRIFLDGFTVAVLNPKTALFFAAFLPQFLSTTAISIGHTMVLGATFVLIAAITDTLYAISASAVMPWLRRKNTYHPVGRLISGGVFIGLGVLTALSGHHPKP